MKNLGRSERSNMTSFHGDVFMATVEDLLAILGKPAYENNTGHDKTNFDWTMETADGEVFTVYDWNEYKPLDHDESIEWHIGGHDGNATGNGLSEIAEALNNL